MLIPRLSLHAVLLIASVGALTTGCARGRSPGMLSAPPMMGQAQPAGQTGDAWNTGSPIADAVVQSTVATPAAAGEDGATNPAPAAQPAASEVVQVSHVDPAGDAPLTARHDGAGRGWVGDEVFSEDLAGHADPAHGTVAEPAGFGRRGGHLPAVGDITGISSAAPGHCYASPPAMLGPCYAGGAPHGYAPPPGWIPNPQGIDPHEFLCDGGDAPPPARPGPRDTIIGVGLEDTVARYTTDRGEVQMAESNRVCLYAPRFAAVRRVTGAELGTLAVGAQRMLTQDGPLRVEMEQPHVAVTGRDELVRRGRVRGPDAMRARDRGVPVENVMQPYLAEDALALLTNLTLVQRGTLEEHERPRIKVGTAQATVWSVDLEVVVAVAGQAAATLTRDQVARELVVYDFPDDGRLRICKLADRGDALPGEVVNFILRVDNVGDSPLHNIVLTDNLTTRLEYVAESQTSTREAEFSTQVNDGQSLQLTWKFADELKPGEGAVIEFQTRVR